MHKSLTPWRVVKGFSVAGLLRAFSHVVCIGFVAAVYRSGRSSIMAMLCHFKVLMCWTLLAKLEARSECLSHSLALHWCELLVQRQELAHNSAITDLTMLDPQACAFSSHIQSLMKLSHNSKWVAWISLC
jgi:hypothetical protein